MEGRELLPDSTWAILPSQCDTGTHVQFMRKSLFLRPFSVNFSAITCYSINLQSIISPLKTPTYVELQHEVFTLIDQYNFTLFLVCTVHAYLLSWSLS